MGGGVAANRIQDLIGALRIGDGAAVDPLERRDRIGGREPLGSDIDEVVQWAEGFGVRRGSYDELARQQCTDHEQEDTSLAAHPLIIACPTLSG